ncbi:fimbrial protein [Dyella amyloliquefaciens]|uniref:fimbrial protein n=1 Tax=Dyella amyloliquefaciens TaxID=1770545 RepID=UPI0013EEB92A|nr:fimbrial protein [Dyella amyloliquefaciens]
MKKLLLSAVLAASFGAVALAPQSAQAADGTITVSGTVASTTCTITGSAGVGSAVTVQLPTVSTSAFSTSNVAGRTAFQLNLASCDPSLASKTAVSFFDGANIQSDGNLKNIAATNPAGGVEVQLLNADDASAIVLNNLTTATQNSHGATITGNAATLKYFAQYYKSGTVGAGSVNTTVNFTINYQ